MYLVVKFMQVSPAMENAYEIIFMSPFILEATALATWGPNELCSTIQGRIESHSLNMIYYATWITNTYVTTST